MIAPGARVPPLAGAECPGQTSSMGSRRWSRTDWLLVVGVAGLAALAVRSVLRARGLAMPTFGMGVGELVLILVIVSIVYWAARLRR